VERLISANANFPLALFDIRATLQDMIVRLAQRRIPIKVQLRMIFMDVCCGPPSQDN
jgi:hypothetical protein